MIMKRIIYIFAALLLSVAASAQTSDYQRRYNALVDRVGFAGVGVETLIENWSKAEPDNLDMLRARFYFYLVKSQSTEVVSRSEPKYLGISPILSLKDSTGADIHYYEILKYDDEIFGLAIKSVDKMIAVSPERMDFRFLKANPIFHMSAKALIWPFPALWLWHMTIRHRRSSGFIMRKAHLSPLL